jgi:GT2 family glycosyltransferase/glycosyltransferase involved in cell wall biosynthesis
VNGSPHLFVTYSGVYGGAERILVDLASAAPEDVVLACPPGALADAATAAGIRVFTLRQRRLQMRAGAGARVRAVADLVGHRRELRRLTADLRPPVTILWGMRSALAGLSAAPGRVAGFGPSLGPWPGRVVVVHNDFVPGPAIGRLLLRACVAADATVVLSEACAQDLDPDGVLGDRLSVIHPGVDASERAATTPPRPPVVVIAGALVGWKRPELALEICAVARRTLPELRLRVLGAPIGNGDGDGDGDGDGTLARLRARAARTDLAGAIDLVGASATVAAELERATCLLHCADREPFGLVVAEALAAGRPVVVPAAAGPAEIVDPSCGLTYPPGDADAAAAALVALCSDPARAQRMGEAGRRRAATSFGRARARARFAAVVGIERREPTAARRGSPAGPPLALVTVTHDSAETLATLLRSAQRHLPGIRVIVVDCGSRDDSLAVARSHPVAVAVDAGANLGFGRGSNLGLERVTEPVTVFVNPDVELIDDSLRELAAASLTPEGGSRLLAPRVLYPDGSRQDSVHPAPGTTAELARVLLAPDRTPGRLGVALAPWRSQRPRAVGWAVGCALGGRTETLRRLGPFSDQIFLYGEDLELGLRATREGVQTWFWPAARVLHARAHTTARAYGGEPFERLARARHRAIALGAGARAARRDDLTQAALFAGRIAVKRTLGRDADRERSQLRAALGARSSLAGR